MNSENQQKVIKFFLEYKTASGRQLAGALRRSNKSTWSILMHLLRRRVIAHSETEGRRKLKLSTNWEGLICHPKTEPQRKPAPPAITEVCRQNCQGHMTHPIFGRVKQRD